MSAVRVGNQVRTGATGVRGGVAEVMADVNGRAKASFPGLFHEMLAGMRPFPAGATEGGEDGAWVRQVCTPERFRAAVEAVGADVGVGLDGFATGK